MLSVVRRALPYRDRLHDVRWLVAGYAGVGGFVALEGAARQGGSASSLDASTEDQGTTRLVVASYVLAVGLPPLLRRLRLRRLPSGVAGLGVAVEAAGLGLRFWSMRTLGASYSRTLRTTDAQQVVARGPYRLVRHPGYLGSMLTWTGFALTSQSLPTVVSISGLLAGAYGRRIAAEERLLIRNLPGYLDYSRGTKKLVPFVW
jgi:protein-S-isoprenylcysteine O-methyltransferase Ste14